MPTIDAGKPRRNATTPDDIRGVARGPNDVASPNDNDGRTVSTRTTRRGYRFSSRFVKRTTKITPASLSKYESTGS
jgi:hypothetical protein